MINFTLMFEVLTAAVFVFNGIFSSSHDENSTSKQLSSYKIQISTTTIGNQSDVNGSPILKVIVTNMSRYKSSFSLTSPQNDYHIKVSYRKDTTLKWVSLPNPFPTKSRKPSLNGFKLKFRNIRVDLAPGESATDTCYTDSFNMRAEGYYKIVLAMDLPDPTYHSNKSEDTLDQSKDITIESNTIYIQHKDNKVKSVTPSIAGDTSL